MHPCLLFLLAFNTITAVNAGLFVVKPLQGSICHAGKPCSVDWLDNGIYPLLTAIGVVDVGLYHGKQQLVQPIQSVNVATAHSLTFTPIPGAGPNSDNYYISLVSTSLLSNTSQPFTAYSSFFRLDGMTGSFDRPQSAATPSFPIPPSVATSNRPVETGDVLSTITVGVIHTSTSISSKPPHTPTLPGKSSEAHFLTLDIPIINALSLIPSGFPSVISPPPNPVTSTAARLLTSFSIPLPSDTVADTTTENSVAILSSPIASAPVADTPAPNGAVTSSSPLPSPTVVNTTPQNGATVCNISSAINIFIAVVTLYLVMGF